MRRLKVRTPGREAPFRISLALLLSASFAAVTAAALLLVGGISLLSSRLSLEELIRDRALLIVDAIEARIRGHLDPIPAHLLEIARWIEADPMRLERRSELAAYIRGTMAGVPQVPEIALTLPDHRTVRVQRASGLTAVEDWSDRPDIVQLISGAKGGEVTPWSAPLFRPELAETIVVHRRPIFAGGTMRGVLLASVTIGDLSRQLDEFGRALRVSPFILYGRDRVLAHPTLAGAGFSPSSRFLRCRRDLDRCCRRFGRRIRSR